MVTTEQYAFFRSLYDEEERTSETLANRANIYLGIIAAFLATLLLKADDVSKSIKTLGVSWLFALALGMLFAGALIFVLLAIRIRPFEVVTDPEEIIAEWPDSGLSNEEFFLDRISDYAVAANRNLAMNNKVAAMLLVAGWLLVTAMVLILAMFTFVFYVGTHHG